MTTAGGSTALDARALALLGELLDDDAGRRASRLQDLQAQDPHLHARLLRLLQASQDPSSSQHLAGVLVGQGLSLIHIWRCRRIERCRSRWSPYH